MPTKREGSSPFPRTKTPQVLTTAFGPVAPYYDLLMSKVPYDMWVDYYRLLLATHGQRPNSFLDVCCGTGTVAEMLAQQGHDVAGIDISAPMIERAKASAAGRGYPIEYQVADARDFELGRTFDAAFSFFDSLNYIADSAGLSRAIKCVADHVRPGGSFIFDLNTAYAFEAKLFDQRDLRPRSKIRYKWVGDYDPATRLIRVNMDFWVNDAHFNELHVQRAHPEREVVDYLYRSGFSSIYTYNSYTLDPVRPKSDRIHFVAIK